MTVTRVASAVATSSGPSQDIRRPPTHTRIESALLEGSEMEAIVLAGGLGSRLRSVVPDLPKPMAPINGEPFLALLLRALAKGEFQAVTLAVGYKAEQIRNYFGARFADLPLTYSLETEPLGTGGAICLALCKTTSRDVFILNGDTYLELDYTAMIATHRKTNTTVTVAVKQVVDAARYGTVELNGDHICRFVEKGRHGPGMINAGVYVISRNLLLQPELPPAFSFETEFLGPRAPTLCPLAFRTPGIFIDIGVPTDYSRAQTQLANLSCPQSPAC